MGLFHLVESPNAFPHRTLLGNSLGPVVATNVDINGYVFVDRVEGYEIARLFEFVEGEVHETAVAERDERIADLEAALATSLERVAELEASQNTVNVVSIDHARELLTAKRSR